MTTHRRLDGAFARLRQLATSASIRQAVSVSLVFSAATLLAGAVAFVVVSQELRVRLANDAQQMAENLAVTYQIAGLSELKSQIATNAATTRDFSNLYLYIDNSRAIVFGNFNVKTPFVGLAELHLNRDIVLPSTAASTQPKNFIGYGIRTHSGWIIAARDMRWVAATREILVQSVALGLGAALILSIILAVAMARRNERRIALLYQVLDQVAAGDLTARYKAGSERQDDIGRMAQSINRMLDRLAVTVDSLRQVSNDVAHDLRTPLTRLRARIEPLLARTDLPADAAQELISAENQLDSVVKTFNAVLRIAQLEAASDQGSYTKLDVAALCGSIHEMLAPVAEETGKQVTITVPDHPVFARADREMLAQAVVNLVENAIRHCPTGSLIAIQVRDDAGTTIAVCDDGPGIPAGERDNVLRRYYRLEKSRNTEGSGLGLSLVAAIVRRHGGTLTFDDNNPGLCATIALPVV